MNSALTEVQSSPAPTESTLFRSVADVQDWTHVHDGDLADFMVAAVEQGDLELAASMLRRRHDLPCAVRFSLSPDVGASRVLWEVNLPEEMHFVFSSGIASPGAAKMTILNLVWISPIFVSYAQSSQAESGAVLVNLFDVGLSPGLSFCDNREGHFLIPDSLFVSQMGYHEIRKRYAEHYTPWEQRKPLALWRGSTTGQPADDKTGWRSLPRISLCVVTSSRSDLFDVGLSEVVQIPDDQAISEIREREFLRDFIPASQFIDYKYQIDIDGNTNSWPGLFFKLLTGSPVLKVASPHGYRQWYYSKLMPWFNFVPIATDLSDLEEKVRWLKAHDELARQIGEKGRSLALSIGFEQALIDAVPVIAAAMRAAAYASAAAALHTDTQLSGAAGSAET